MTSQMEIKAESGTDYFQEFFATASIVSGSVTKKLSWTVEPIVSPGIDGERWRTRRKARDHLVLDCLYSVRSTDSFKDAEENIGRMIGRLCKISLYVGGFGSADKVYYIRAIILRAEIAGRFGPLIGAGAKTGSTKTLRVSLTCSAQSDTD